MKRISIGDAIRHVWPPGSAQQAPLDEPFKLAPAADPLFSTGPFEARSEEQTERSLESAVRVPAATAAAAAASGAAARAVLKVMAADAAEPH